jgi:succinate dehydrogenase/fumarate reductase flavoprotein subunit
MRIASDRRPAVEVVPQREDGDADDRVDDLAAVVRQGQRAGHHAEAEAADRHGHHEAVLENAAAERDHAQRDGDDQADLVHDRMQQDAARRSEHREEDRAGEAVDEAQAGQGDAQPVERTLPQSRRQTHFTPLPAAIL